MNNALLERRDVFEVKGKGSSKQEAVEKAFLQLREQVVSRIDVPIVHMIPNQVEVVSFHEVEQTEAFLYFFLKRKKKEVMVTMNVEVLIKYIQM